MTLVFLLEEPSMEAFLRVLLDRFMPGIDAILIPHQGKSDLEASIPRKLRGWNDPAARFIVVRDQDSSDCKVLKEQLAALCTSRPNTLVRIVCHELEAWYLGDLEAVALAFSKPAIVSLQATKKFRNPDRLGSPSRELAKLVPAYQKVGGSRDIAAHFQPARCRSPSFKAFFSGVERVIQDGQLASPPTA